jgi:hypothetical protein
MKLGNIEGGRWKYEKECGRAEEGWIEVTEEKVQESMKENNTTKEIEDEGQR